MHLTSHTQQSLPYDNALTDLCAVPTTARLVLYSLCILVTADVEMADSLRPRRNSKDVLRSMLSNLTHLNLTDEVVVDDPVLKQHGGFCDVFEGRWISKRVCIYKVAIKRLRVHVKTDRDFAKVSGKSMSI